MSNYKLLYITCGSKIEAVNLGKLLVKNKLAACTNIVSNIKSIFNWKHKVTQSQEAILIGKTQKKNVSKIIKLVERKHSYKCPCVLFFDIEKGNNKFLSWIKKNS